MSQEYTEREKRNWWSVSDGKVRFVTGFSCAPQNEGYWWCPQLWLSLTEGNHLFKSREEAFNKAIAEAESDIKLLQQRIESLRKQKKQ